MPVITKVTLTADKTTIKPDGTESAVLTAKVFDQNGNVMTGETITITKDGAAFTGTIFSSTASGSFAFVAKAGNVSSDTLTIKAETIITTSGYSTNGKGVGKNKTITIDGKNTSSEWTDDMLIATALAGDDPRTLGSSWSMHETPWNATHMWAAWDDSNLYVAWQYVDVTDIADPSNAGSSAGTRIFGMNLIQWLAFDTKSGAGASIDMWGKNGGKPYWTGADKPETQIYLASNFTQGYMCNAVNDVFTVPVTGAVSTDYKKLISSGGFN